MKNVTVMLLMIALSAPARAATSADTSNQKIDIQTKYNNEKNSENQSYDAQVAQTKQNGQNDPNKLNYQLKELQIEHEKRINDLDSDEKIDLLKVDEQNND